MVKRANSTTPGETALLERARRGDERAYEDLVGPHRSELHAHCYRVLASAQDAEDAVQEALLRAWRGLPRFEGRSSVRTWLFKIATHTALDAAERRSRRELPIAHGPVASRGQASGEALTEALWVEPYPNRFYEVPDGSASPEARYELRESVELAFVAALQGLPAQQRAVLVLRDVMGFASSEVADMLSTTVAAANSALQRARAKLAGQLPARSQQAELGALGRPEVLRLAERYCEAFQTADVGSILSLLVADARWSMPPLAAWYQGREAIEDFIVREAFEEQWRHRVTQANGQLAVGCYTLDKNQDCYVASVLDVIALRDGRIADVTGFITAELLGRSGKPDMRFVGAETFPRFGLPATLKA